MTTSKQPLLQTKISLRGIPTVVAPFYALKPLPRNSEEATGAANLIKERGLDRIYNKFDTDFTDNQSNLSSFLPHLPFNVDVTSELDNSSLLQLVDKPPPNVALNVRPLSSQEASIFLKLQPSGYTNLPPDVQKLLDDKPQMNFPSDGTINWRLDPGLGLGGDLIGNTGDTPSKPSASKRNRSGTPTAMVGGDDDGPLKKRKKKDKKKKKKEKIS